MSLKPRSSMPSWATLCSLTFSLALTACGGAGDGSSSSEASSVSSVSSTAESSSSSSSAAESSSTPTQSSSAASSASSTPVVRPTGPSVDENSGWTPNASWQSPAFAGQTRAPEVLSDFEIKTEVKATGIREGWAFEFLPDGERVILTEKAGNLRIIEADGSIGQPISGVPEVFYKDQAGLMDVALSSTFAEDRTLFLSFAETRDGGQATSVARAQLSADETSLENVEVIFRQTPSWTNVTEPMLPFAYNGHFGSRIAVDNNGNLYITVGERFNEAIRVNAQVLDNYLGKVSHITPSGAPAPDNPMINQDGVKPEIWSYGHRNVQAVDIHPITGEAWTVEHGPQGGDEVNKPEGGKNYGWPVITYGMNYSYWGGTGNPIGDDTPVKEGMEQPVYYWDPVIAPSAASFYHGTMFPEWNNNLLITGLVPGDLTRLIFDGDEVIGEERLLRDDKRLRDVRIADDGSVWVLNESDSQLIRLYR